MPGRSFSAASGYRYGFNGQEKSTEIDAAGNSMTAEFWQYDARIGRRWNVDPVVKEYESPYATFANNPIWLVDKNGADSTPVNNPGSQPTVAPNLSKVTNIENVMNGKQHIQFGTDVNVPSTGIFGGFIEKVGKRNCNNTAECADYARTQVFQKNYVIAQGAPSRIDTYIDESRQTDLSKLNLQTAVDLIIDNLKIGNAVMAGVMYNPNKEAGKNGNDNRATNHYVTIVGMGNDDQGSYFSYYDNVGGTTGTDLVKNKFRLTITPTLGIYYFVDRDNSIPLNYNKEVKLGEGNSRYILTEVRPNKGGVGMPDYRPPNLRTHF
jgi:hypothetical protein